MRRPLPAQECPLPTGCLLESWPRRGGGGQAPSDEDKEYEPPLADFLLSRQYQSFPVELQGEEIELKSGRYAEIEELRSTRAHHLVFSEEYIDWELWISEETSLPMRLVIIAGAVSK